MKILAIEYDVQENTPEAFTPYLKPEAAKVWDLYQAGVIRELYFRQDHPQAVLILECENTEVAQEYLGTLPLVREGFIAFDLVPLKPYLGFSRLFTSQA